MGNYPEAAKLIESYDAEKIKSKKNLFECANIFWHANQLEASEKYFLKLTDHKKYKKQSLLTLAQIYQHQFKFRTAIDFYKKYVRLLEPKDLNIPQVQAQISQCVNGIFLSKRKTTAIVQPLSEKVNTNYDEYKSYASISQPHTFYYSAIRADNKGGKRNDVGRLDQQSGRLRADIYVIHPDSTQVTQKNWLNQYVNSNYEDVLCHIGSNGKSILFLQTWDREKGKILTDTLSNNPYRFEFANFQSPLRPELGDHDFSIYQDSLMIFSSDRIGGYGGKDLYLSVFRKNKWTEPVNLGSKINSPFDEIHPYLANDGSTLYYSHNGSSSIGGYDVYYNQYSREARGWSMRNQLGIPINSPGDDLYFRLLQDGSSASFSSDRKSNNQGGLDLYLAIFKEELSEQPELPYDSYISQLYENQAIEQLALGTESSSDPIENKTNKIDPSKSNVFSSNESNIPFYEIRYKDENFLQDPAILKSVEILVAFLNENRDFHLIILVHSDENVNAETNLYFGQNLGKSLVKKMESMGSNSRGISVISLGTQFPVASHSSQIANNPNKRIEFFFVQKISGIFGHSIKPKNQNKNDVTEKLGGLKYTIQLGESSLIFKHPLINNEFFHFSIWRNQSQKSEYYVGIYEDYNSALMDNKSYSGLGKTKITAMIEGIPLEKNQLIDYAAEYPDLLLLLNEYVKD